MGATTLSGLQQTAGLLFQAGAVAELRILHTKQGTVSGYYDDFTKLALDAGQFDGKAPAIYVTLNPVNPSLLARAANRLLPYARHTTSDADIVRRRWLPIDCDPVRPSGVSATDSEHQAALERAEQVRELLGVQGWPKPIYADSSNGAHLLYSIDLPNDTPSTELVRKGLEALSFQFSDDRVQIDVKTCNAARIWKYYGTQSCKGDNLPERPHRRSRILEIPESLHTVSVDLLKQLTARQPEAPKQQTMPKNAFDLEEWITAHNLPVVSHGPWNGGTKWIVNPCPWNREHNNRAAYVVQFASGAISAGCHHNGCSGNDWQALRDLVEPGRKLRRSEAKAPGDKPHVPTLSPSKKSKLQLVCLEDVEPQEVQWLWPGRFPLGKISLVDGDPGLGKSVALLDVAARVSQGLPMPDGARSDLDGPAGVVVLSVEDDAADTLRPRLDAARADVARIYTLVGDEVPAIPEGLDEIEAAVDAVGAKLLIIDPLMAYLSGDVNSHRDQDVRRALAPLATMAARKGIAVVVIRHLNKGAASNPLYRGGGSIGLIGAARSALVVAKDPDDPSGERRVIASTKCNLAQPPVSLAYHLEAAQNGAVRIAWDGPSSHNAGALLALVSDEDRQPIQEAKEFLTDALQSGPQPAKSIQKEARNAGIAERTLWRAKTALGVAARKEGFDNGWVWELPQQANVQPKAAKVPEGCHQNELGKVAAFGSLGRLRGEVDDDGRRAYASDLALSLGYPELALVGRGATIMAGQAKWDRFLQQPTREDLTAAIAGLEYLARGDQND